MSATGMSRRSVLRAGALTTAAGVAGFLVARRSDAAKARSATSAANAYGAPTTHGGHLLTRLDKIPPGGGVVVGSRHVVLTRDDQGTVHGFSSTCTHQGCTVSGVEHGTIVCPCHGSRFDIRTGAAVQGPATKPLREVSVVVRGDNVFTD